MKHKRLEAWAMDASDRYWVYPFKQDADDKLHDMKTGREEDVGRVVRLVECGPDETVMPKSAAAVVRAAVAMFRVSGGAHWTPTVRAKLLGVLRAVERMQKGRRK